MDYHVNLDEGLLDDVNSTFKNDINGS